MTSRRFSTQMQLERVFHTLREAVLPPAELDSIESEALVAKGKLVLCMKSTENDASGQIKARLVAMRIVSFDKHMSVRRDAALHDLWSPVASTAEARIVPAESGGVRTGDRKHGIDGGLTSDAGRRHQAIQNNS